MLDGYVSATELSPDLVQYACSRDYATPHSELPTLLETELCELADQVVGLVVRAYNRLIEYARTVKGQYWLCLYEFRPGKNASSLLTHFGAKLRAPGGTWNGFRPGSIHIDATWVDERRYIARDDWPAVQAWMNDRARPPLVGSLLAGAEELAGKGHARTGLTEAVTALEVAVHDFARRPRPATANLQQLLERAGLKNLASYVDHLGFSTSLAYLLPMLLPPEDLSDETLALTLEAVRERQSVVHNGQRTVKAERLGKFLVAIRQVCTLLAHNTDRDDTPPDGPSDNVPSN